MVVKRRRLECGSHGFGFPNVPKAPRSCRRKILNKSSDDGDDDEICAIDLLASLAGKLLQERESSSSAASTNGLEGDNHCNLGKAIIKQEQVCEYKSSKAEFLNQGNSDSKSTDETTSENCLLNKFMFCENDGVLERISVSDYDMAHDLKPVGCENKKGESDFSSKFAGSVGETGGVFVNSGFEEQREAINGLGDGDLTIADACLSIDTSKLCVPIPESVRSDGDVKFQSCKDRVCNGSVARQGKNHTELGSRDDDENVFRYYKLSSKFKSFRSPTRIGDRRIRKLLSSKYWKAVPKLKDYESKRADGALKALYRKRKSRYGHNGWQRDSVFKRRRSSDRGSVVTSDGGFSSESVCNTPEKGYAANCLLSSGIGLHTKDSHVKFSIKSFKIPELFVEVPEAATVGSLKRTVLEAVTALLGGGLRVGVLVQGKKVRDDSKTLSQTGISSEANFGNLGFTLEPGPAKVSRPICLEEPLISLPSDSTNSSERSAASPMLDSGVPCCLRDADDAMNSGDGVENYHELVPYQSDTSADEPTSDSRALVPVPALDVEALTMVPVNPKPKRTDYAQRRARRPFSVGEVEALVQAVEELGTGRWRDVKLRAFENADHRTYVDLKDKWKTLVHTASISPQQRRGEPVPQELLDRVLGAHAYWSQHQVKQHRGNIQQELRKPRRIQHQTGTELLEQSNTNWFQCKEEEEGNV